MRCALRVNQQQRIVVAAKGVRADIAHQQRHFFAQTLGLGIDQRALKAELGLIIVVRRMEVDFLRPALYDDALTVTTDLRSLGGARIDLAQAVLRGAETLFTASVTLVCVGPDGRALRLPDDLRAALQAP